MNVAVLTLTRDRLDYTKHCFGTLLGNAGCEFGWWVLDQASGDETVRWVRENTHATVVESRENVGICRGLNMLLDRVDLEAADVIVRFDNDCEVTQPGTLRTVVEVAATGTIVAPHVRGLRHPPPTVGRYTAAGRTVSETTILGGIFMAVPAQVFRDGFRYDETQPLWTGDERVCDWFRGRGGRCGYVDGVAVNHYETTDGQHARYPAYFAQKRAEGCPV